jgi:hypothetical protein
MPKLLIEIDLENEAFQDGKRGTELSHILEVLAFTIREEGDAFEMIAMYDSNGNYVGTAEVLDEE